MPCWPLRQCLLVLDAEWEDAQVPLLRASRSFFRQGTTPMPRCRLSLVLLIGSTLASTAMAFDSWPQWRGLNRDAHSPEKGLLDHWEGAPPLLWKTRGLGDG